MSSAASKMAIYIHTRVIEVTGFNLRSYVTSRSFRGHHGLSGLQNGNIHIQTRVIEVADFKYEVKICHRDFYHSRTLVYGAIAL